MRDDLTTEQQKTLESYKAAMEISVEYCRPHWEKFIRLYKLWKGRRPPQLNNTMSKVMINLWHQSVQDRIPKIMDNVFGSEQLITLRADSPKVEFFRGANEEWLRDILIDKVKIRERIHPTMQTMMIGGTAYRMPVVRYVDGKPKFTSRTLDFFQVLPAPGAGCINPADPYSGEGVDWLFVVDEWAESKIKSHKGLDQEEVAKFLDEEDRETNASTERSATDEFRNQFQQIGQVSYGTVETWRDRLAHVQTSAGTRKRRITHWFMRDRHVIIGEDSYVLYDGPAILKGGQLPVAKYVMTPDIDNFFGISYLEMLDDLLRAAVMNVNMRFDHMLGVMYPMTWVRKDIVQSLPKREFAPKPFAVHEFPMTVRNISEAVWHDRRPDVTQDAFLNEDTLKMYIQKIGGQTETTADMNNIVGNDTATGVTSILDELSGRPNMESLIVEQTGFREECQILMALSEQHFTTRDGNTEFIKNASDSVGFNWTEVDPDDITNSYTVVPQGVKFLAERQIKFQQLLAMYPHWNQNPIFDQHELARQVDEVGGLLPDIDRALLPPAPTPEPGAAAAGGGLPAGGLRPGGLASAQDTQQQSESTANRTSVEPGTGAQVKAAAV